MGEQASGKAWFPKVFFGAVLLRLIRWVAAREEGGKGPCVSD